MVKLSTRTLKSIITITEIKKCSGQQVTVDIVRHLREFLFLHYAGVNHNDPVKSINCLGS